VLAAVLPLAVTSVLLLVAGTLLTGGLHLDGLMDTCDGLFGGRTRARRLEIMRDSRVGSYGALAGALQLLLKYATLVSRPPDLRGAALVVTLTCGRWSMVPAMWGSPYARPEGLGRAYKDGLRPSDVVVATLLAAAVCWIALELRGAIVLGVALALSLAGAWWLARCLGGLTGDCYGALNEVVEVSGLVLLVALVGQ
jgi:adenosylcobinamide-GDP ribazoletransferase